MVHSDKLRHKRKKNSVPDVHLARVDLHNASTSLLIGHGELNLTIQPTWAQQSGVQDINPVSGSNHLRIIIEKVETREIQAYFCLQYLNLQIQTFTCMLGWKPSSWLSSSNMVLCTSLSPAFSLSKRLVPIASSSSMKMMDGAFSLARANASRTSLAPSPINICTNWGPANFKNVAWKKDKGKMWCLKTTTTTTTGECYFATLYWGFFTIPWFGLHRLLPAGSFLCLVGHTSELPLVAGCPDSQTSLYGS